MDGGVYGNDGRDFVFGNDGIDTLYGNGSSDYLYGNDHNDALHAKDNFPDNAVGGGGGFNNCYVDVGLDPFTNCDAVNP